MMDPRSNRGLEGHNSRKCEKTSPYERTRDLTPISGILVVSSLSPWSIILEHNSQQKIPQSIKFFIHHGVILVGSMVSTHFSKKRLAPAFPIQHSADESYTIICLVIFLTLIVLIHLAPSRGLGVYINHHLLFFSPFSSFTITHSYNSHIDFFTKHEPILSALTSFPPSSHLFTSLDNFLAAHQIDKVEMPPKRKADEILAGPSKKRIVAAGGKYYSLPIMTSSKLTIISSRSISAEASFRPEWLRHTGRESCHSAQDRGDGCGALADRACHSNGKRCRRERGLPGGRRANPAAGGRFEPAENGGRGGKAEADGGTNVPVAGGGEAGGWTPRTGMTGHAETPMEKRTNEGAGVAGEDSRGAVHPCTDGSDAAGADKVPRIKRDGRGGEMKFSVLVNIL